jgi:prepilin-type N-terminal cleavage/methylation domain-containing protein
MTLVTKTNLPFQRKRGFTLVELTVVIAISGILIISFMTLFEATMLLFKRIRSQDIVSLQVDPLKAIFQTHVKASRYALYDSIAGAIDKTGGLVTGADSDAGASDFALRCVRRDGAGIFIIYWDTTLSTNTKATWYTTGRFPTVQLRTATGTVAVTGDGPLTGLLNNAIPLTSALSRFAIDISQGFVQVNVSIPTPVFDNNGARYSYVRSNTPIGQNVEIPYAFFVDSTL